MKGQPRNRRPVQSMLVGLLCALLLVCGDGLEPLPFFAAHLLSASSEEEGPARENDTADTPTVFSAARHRAARRHHGPPPSPLQPVSIVPLPPPLSDASPLCLPPPPRERANLNGVGA